MVDVQVPGGAVGRDQERQDIKRLWRRQSLQADLFARGLCDQLQSLRRIPAKPVDGWNTLPSDSSLQARHLRLHPRGQDAAGEAAYHNDLTVAVDAVRWDLVFRELLGRQALWRAGRCARCAD